MKIFFISLLAVVPWLALAQTQTITDVNTLSQKLIGIGNIILYLLMSFALIYIVYGVIKYLLMSGKPEDRADALKRIGWGIAGLAIMLSIWGLVNIITNTLRTTPTDVPIQQISHIQSPVVQ